MSTSIYDDSVPVFLSGLAVLRDILGKGKAHAEAAGLDPAELTQARLFEDMFTLVQQVQAAADTARRGTIRIAGLEMNKVADEEATFDELLARVASTRAFLEGLDRSAFEGAEARQFTVAMGGMQLPVTGRSYLMGWCIPNFFFHVATAYDILRHKGVKLGKRDFIAPFMTPFLGQR